MDLPEEFSRKDSLIQSKLSDRNRLQVNVDNLGKTKSQSEYWFSFRTSHIYLPSCRYSLSTTKKLDQIKHNKELKQRKWSMLFFN